MSKVNFITQSMLILFTFLVVSCTDQQPKFPMGNDENFDATVTTPSFNHGSGPKILIDGGHNNFFVQFNFFEPLQQLLISDGYVVEVSKTKFSLDILENYKILIVATPMATNFMDSVQRYEGAFDSGELKALKTWVQNGGSLLVFSEHFPFDLAVQPLLKVFEIDTSIGQVIDRHNFEYNPGQIIFESASIETNHPIIDGKRSVKKLASYGGSALTGENYTNILKLSDKAENLEREWRGAIMGPIGSGNSQGLVGSYGRGKIAAFGDSNGFFAMQIETDHEHKLTVGMNDPSYDWKNFVLNTFDWLASD